MSGASVVAELTGMLHGGSHHQEGHGDADGDEHLDQLGHPGVGPVTLINDLHGGVEEVDVQMTMKTRQGSR